MMSLTVIEPFSAITSRKSEISLTDGGGEEGNNVWSTTPYITFFSVEYLQRLLENRVSFWGEIQCSYFFLSDIYTRDLSVRRSVLRIM